MREIIPVLTSAEPPWLLRTTIDRLEIESELNRLRAEYGFVTCLLEASKMSTVNGVLKEFAAALEFPDYFGFNGNAFRDCLTDLAWLNPDGVCPLGVCTAVFAAEYLLVDESYEIGWLLELLEDTCREWSIAIEAGELWDRGKVPFHVLFHTSIASSRRLPPELAALSSLEQLPPLA